MTSSDEQRLARIERDRDRARAALGIDEHGQEIRPPRDDLDALDELARRTIRGRYGQPRWLAERDDGDGLTMLGRGLDDE
jgi:hypothetical protein